MQPDCVEAVHWNFCNGRLGLDVNPTKSSGEDVLIGWLARVLFGIRASLELWQSGCKCIWQVWNAMMSQTNQSLGLLSVMKWCGERAAAITVSCGEC